MGSPRINPERSEAAIDRFVTRWAYRYGIAVITSATAGVVVLSFRSIDPDYHVLFFFVAILLASIFGGWGPGLLATGLTATCMYFATSRNLGAAELRLLVAQGILLSITGRILRSARRRAKDWLAANLQLEQQVLEIGDDERRRIGLDLHDGLGQHLTGISLLSETLTQQLAAGVAPNPANIENITHLVSESVRITRDLAKNLSPVTLEREGLIAAIEELAGTSSTLFGIQCKSEFDGQELDLDRARSLHLFRIAQEAVNNSVRHGKAKNVRVELTRRDNELNLTISDDGLGLSHKTIVHPGLGLRIMQYRARMLGATLTAERIGPQGGTIVKCQCPINGHH
ncbi:MAG TPA: sensor histidine kinase [Tepidisphaeraceae bacterium]|nr:sensor histidine kinase [Tepidisphaeraceae bacterium]